MITAQQLAQACDCSLMTAQNWQQPINQAMTAYGISGGHAAMFLANVAVESSRLSTLVENLNYSVDALLSKFGRHRISESDARAYGRAPGRQANQQAIANRIYGGDWGRKNLGNTQTGDGWLFRGQGALQSTGRANARALTARLRARLSAGDVPDFEETPSALTAPVWAAYSAADYVDMRGLAGVAALGDFDGYCDAINIGRKTEAVGDSHGYAERSALWVKAKSALGVT